MGELKLTAKNAPEKKFRAGNIEVAVWRNQNPEGKSFYSISIQKNYKEAEQWKSTTSLNKNDIPRAILALQEAYKYTTLKKTTKEIMEEEMQELDEQFSGIPEEKVE